MSPCKHNLNIDDKVVVLMVSILAYVELELDAAVLDFFNQIARTSTATTTGICTH